MTRKRAPGGGRKPQGEFRGKTATLTTRITTETRQALDSAARKSRRSLSQEVERRLIDSIQKDPSRDRQPHIRALGEAFMMMVHGVERRTGHRWCDDAFTVEAVRHGLNFLISHFGPNGTPTLPKTLKEAAAKLPPELAQHYREPTEIGLSEAGIVITLIERWRAGDISEISQSAQSAKNVEIHVPNEWFAHSQLLRDLSSR
jgi:hypothetical protein